MEATATTPLSLVGEDDLSEDVSTTPALVGGVCPGTSLGIGIFVMESWEGVVDTGIMVVVGGFKGVEILLEFVNDGGMTVRDFGFLHPCVSDKRNLLKMLVLRKIYQKGLVFGFFFNFPYPLRKINI